MEISHTVGASGVAVANSWEKNKAGRCVGRFFLVSGCLFLLPGGSGDWGVGLLSAWQRLMPHSAEGHELSWMSRAADSGRCLLAV